MDTNLSDTDQISNALLDARNRTLALVENLSEQQLTGPVLSTINPLRWEIAHAAHFHEFWVLRHLGKKKPIMKMADQLFDSITINHEDRWELNLPSMEETYQYMDDVLQSELSQLNEKNISENEKYFYLLALFHEDMHTEAFMYTYQTLSYPCPEFVSNDKQISEKNFENEDIDIPGGEFDLGASRNNDFIFDNEKWGHTIKLAPFKISKYAVSNQEYLDFVEDHGYKKKEFWSDEAYKWLKERNLQHPVYWKRDDNGQWYERKFDQWYELNSHAAVIHVCWYEAQAFCKWANRRLPTEPEWEFVAATEPESGSYYPKRMFPWGNAYIENKANFDGIHNGTTSVYDFAQGDSAWGCRQMLGNVWEWTDSTFQPYPGFSTDNYTEYSRPLFGKTKVLRGGAWATRGRMLRNTWRNYYGPDRNDVFAGFRTCAK